MTLETYRFGTIDIDDASIITFRDGILGFENLTRYAIVTCEATEPIQWLQSIDDTDVSLPIINPFIVKEDYDVEVDDSELSVIETYDENEIVVFCVTVVPSDIKKITVNLAAPIIINYVKNLGKQVVMGVVDDKLIRYSAFDAIVEYFRKVAQDACTDAESK